jgi:hypothetical protein
MKQMIKNEDKHKKQLEIEQKSQKNYNVRNTLNIEEDI